MTPLHEEVLSAATARVFARLGAIPEIGSFYLAGGTGLALQLGHRASEDLDLFSERPWTWERVAPMLARAGDLSVDRVEPGTWIGSVAGVRVSLLHYPYVLLGEPIPTRFGLPIASLLDIGAMKLADTSQRGSRKDFVDLYYLGAAGLGVRELFDALQRKAPATGLNPVQVVRSLAFFEEAEEEPEPVMLDPAYDWRLVRRYCSEQARALLAEMLDGDG